MQEKRNRIRLLLAAYAYEFFDSPIMSDAEFDKLAESIDITKKTGRYDVWFQKNFSPSTGQWIHKFPKSGKEGLYRILKNTFKL